MRYAVVLGWLVIACCFTVTSVYLQAIDRIIQKLADNLSSAVSDYTTLCENVKVYNKHVTDFLQKLKAKDPTFRRIAIEHCRIGKPEFPEYINIHAFQMNLGWNDTQAATMFILVNASRHLWMAFDDICQGNTHPRLTLTVTVCLVAYEVCSLKTSTYVRALDKIICDFMGNITPSGYGQLCTYIERYNNYSQQFVEKLRVKDPGFRRMAIMHCDWGKPEFSSYHDRLWYEVWMEWDTSKLDYLDKLVNNTKSLWREYKDLCKHKNYSRYVNRFRSYSNSTEITEDM